MNRAAARAAVATAIASSGFDLVVQGAPETFGGKTKVAVITSGGTERQQLGRGAIQDVNSVAVSVYVQRAANGGSTVEDTLDGLVASVISAIDAIVAPIFFQKSDAGASGAPNRRIDAKMYRVERIFFTVLDEGAT